MRLVGMWQPPGCGPATVAGVQQSPPPPRPAMTRAPNPVRSWLRFPRRGENRGALEAWLAGHRGQCRGKREPVAADRPVHQVTVAPGDSHGLLGHLMRHVMHPARDRDRDQPISHQHHPQSWDSRATVDPTSSGRHPRPRRMARSTRRLSALGPTAKPSCWVRAHTSSPMPHRWCTDAVAPGLACVVGMLSLLCDHPRRIGCTS